VHIELVRHEVLTIALQGFCLEQMLAQQRPDLLRLPIANTRLDWHQLLEVRNKPSASENDRFAEESRERHHFL
jgi:hypothetical protein